LLSTFADRLNDCRQRQLACEFADQPLYEIGVGILVTGGGWSAIGVRKLEDLGSIV
jgi:hypothetical protein